MTKNFYPIILLWNDPILIDTEQMRENKFCSMILPWGWSHLKILTVYFDNVAQIIARITSLCKTLLHFLVKHFEVGINMFRKCSRTTWHILAKEKSLCVSSQAKKKWRNKWLTQIPLAFCKVHLLGLMELEANSLVVAARHPRLWLLEEP